VPALRWSLVSESIDDWLSMPAARRRSSTLVVIASSPSERLTHWPRSMMVVATVWRQIAMTRDRRTADVLVDQLMMINQRWVQSVRIMHTSTLSVPRPFLPRDAVLARYTLWPCVCPSASVKTAKHHYANNAARYSMDSSFLLSVRSPPPNWGAINTWSRKKTLWQITRCVSKTVEDVLQRVEFKLCATAQRCLQSRAPQCLMECCIPLSGIACRQHLQSASCHQLFVPRHQHLMFGRRAFFVADPMAWNLL